MEKKIRVGIITLAIVDFVIVSYLTFSFSTLGPGNGMDNMRYSLRSPITTIRTFLLGFCFSLPVFIAGISTIKFKRLGRWLNIIISIYVVFVNLTVFKSMRYPIYSFVESLFCVVILIFLFLPKVKEQFK